VSIEGSRLRLPRAPQAALSSEGARILQIDMLDHLIVGQSFEGRQGYFSFKEAGYDMSASANLARVG